MNYCTQHCSWDTELAPGISVEGPDLSGWENPQRAEEKKDEKENDKMTGDTNSVGVGRTELGLETKS